MERMTDKLVEIINEQDFCFTPDEMRVVEKALHRFKAYEGTGLEPEAISQLKKIPEIFNCSASDPAQIKQLFIKLQCWADAEREIQRMVLEGESHETDFI